MRKIKILKMELYWMGVFLLFLPFKEVVAQPSHKELDSIKENTIENYKLILKKLNITFLRPGPSGNPQDKNAANSDESQVNPNLNLPKLMLLESGKKVKNVRSWKKRKDEIFEQFDKEVYGRLPENIPHVVWEIKSQQDSILGGYPVLIRNLQGIVDNSSYPELKVKIALTVTTPKNTSKKVPLILKFDWNWPGNPTSKEKQVEPWKKLLLQEGWGFASIIPTSYQADNGAGLRAGIIGLVNKGKERKLDDWGTLRAWAWGASRALDYFESSSYIDATKVGIEGLSRYGKAAMVAMAYDDRFAIGFIGSSGAGGTKILRRNFGEQVENLASSSEYHWFAPNFIKYAGPLNIYDLPVDAHELVALAAPRPLFISTGNPEVEGNWVDAKGMFLGGLYASPAYALFGIKGLVGENYPGVGVFLDSGTIAFRSHKGGHTVKPNWPYFIEFAKNYFK